MAGVESKPETPIRVGTGGGLIPARVLNGDKPADLPVPQATKVELYINLKTGINVPAALSGRADELIE